MEPIQSLILADGADLVVIHASLSRHKVDSQDTQILCSDVACQTHAAKIARDLPVGWRQTSRTLSE